MSIFCCPICGGPLDREPSAYSCPAGHSFDLAREGYVHLLPANRMHSKMPGDDKGMAAARAAFLSKDYYAPLRDALCSIALERTGPAPRVLDTGCGEGYYSARLAAAMGAPLTGLDISKEAVRCAAAKYKACAWLCSTAAHIPVPDGSAGTLTSLFALTLPGEFRRVLREGGIFLQVLAAEDHLLGLKSIIYEELTHKEKNITPLLPGFELLESQEIKFPFTVEGAQIGHLLSMTPHLFRIGKAGAQRLQETQILCDTASCILNIYRAI